MKALLPVLVGVTLAFASAVGGADETDKDVLKLSIERKSLKDALNDWAQQTGYQLIAEIEGELVAPRIEGRLTAQAALERLLEGTPLTYQWIGERLVAVKEKGRVLPASLQTTGAEGKEQGPIRVARLSGDESGRLRLAISDQGAGQNEQGSQGSRNNRRARDAEGDTETLDEIVVTGTHIRGQTAPIGAQLITFDQQDIERSGFTNVQDVVRALPQSFGGGVSEDTRIGVEAGTNSSFATSLNLRGLGAGSTLVLLNGRRLAPGGTEGTFTDISSIALSAVERIEILPDGASAIYGSDAVGGVVNLIVRKDFQGAETSARGGSVTDGDASEYQISQLLGTNWGEGHALLSLDFWQRDALSKSDRRQTATSDLRALGGSNFDALGGNPGTILTALGSYAIPPGQDGTALQPEDFVLDTTNFHNRNAGEDLLPRQKRSSVIAVANHALTDQVHVFADAFFSRREARRHTQDTFVRTLFVPSTNPFFVNPDGSDEPVLVLYHMEDDVGTVSTDVDVDTYNFAVGSNAELGSWVLNAYVGYAREEESQSQDPVLDAIALDNALADSDPATAMNVFGDGSFTNPATLASLRSRSLFETESDISMANMTLGGRLFDAPAGQARLALGAEYRRHAFDSAYRQGDTSLDTAFARNVSAAFAEIVVPFVGTDNRVPAVERLDLSIAGRYENYSDFGSTAIPKVGVTWSPISSLSLHSTWSRSFKAPNLSDMDESLNGSTILPLEDPAAPAGFSDVLVWFGKNADLQEETATILTVGAEIKVPSFSARLTLFDIEFDNRIQSLEFTPEVLDERFAALVTRDPSPAQRERVCADGEFFGSPGACLGFPVAAIVDLRVNNAAITKTRGLDFSADYALHTSVGEFTFDVIATYLLDFSQAIVEAVPPTELLNTRGYPIDFRTRGSVSWKRRALDVTAFVNYADGYRDVATSNRRIDSWTTVDLTSSYEFGAESNAWLTDTTLSLSVQNLFDKSPPFVDNPVGVGYDPENADLLGRFVSLRIRKRW